MRVFGKSLSEYLLPIKFYVIGCIIVVLSQYLIGIPVQDAFPLFLNLTQAAWALLVALSVVKLIKHYGFGFKNVLFLGVLYSLIIHGLKVSIRAIFYAKPLDYLINRFLYGSSLVMMIVLILGPCFIYFKRKRLL